MDERERVRATGTERCQSHGAAVSVTRCCTALRRRTHPNRGAVSDRGPHRAAIVEPEAEEECGVVEDDAWRRCFFHRHRLVEWVRLVVRVVELLEACPEQWCTAGSHKALGRTTLAHVSDKHGSVRKNAATTTTTTTASPELHDGRRARYSAVQYSAVQYSAVQCSTVQCSTVQCSTVQYSTVTDVRSSSSARAMSAFCFSK
jgi:hypothetical protein